MKRANKTDGVTDIDRRNWSNAMKFCWACGSKEHLQTHEIVRRSETKDALCFFNYARLCQSCHEEAHGGWLTREALMTLKLLFDPVSYDPQWIRDHSIRHDYEAGTLPEQIELHIAHRFG